MNTFVDFDRRHRAWVGALCLASLCQVPVHAQTLANAPSGGFASGISVLPPAPVLTPVKPVANVLPTSALGTVEAANTSADTPAGASVGVSAGSGAAPLGCTAASDQAMATDLAALTAQSQKVDLDEQVKLFKDATAWWAQAAAQCSGRAQERAVRNRDDSQHMLDRLAEKLDAGPQCASAHKNASLLQDLARQTLSERRWAEAGALFRKAENTWDLAAERCTGSQQDTANRRREQSAQDGHNAQFCAPLFEKAREHTQTLRTNAATLTREDKQDASMVAETLWRDALVKCQGSAVLEIATNNAKALARERGTPWVARTAPAAPVAAFASARQLSPAAKPGTVSIAQPQPSPAASAVQAAETPSFLSSALSGVSAALSPAVAAESAQTVPLVTTAPGVLTVGSTRYAGQFARDAGAATTVSGTGKVTWASGDVFEGTLVNGLRHGTGTFVWANGQRYTGDWVQDKSTGRAKVHFVNGDDYEGQVQDGRPQGAGRMRYASGDQFDGQFTQGEPDVRGMYLWRNGQRFEGSWKNSRPNGQGTLKFATGNQYEGQVQDGVPHGQGRMLFSGGEIYEGQFRQGEPDGQGSFSWPSGDRYVGQWRAGKKHGQGVFTWKSGESWQGVYEQDVQKNQTLAAEPLTPSEPG